MGFTQELSISFVPAVKIGLSEMHNFYNQIKFCQYRFICDK